MAPCPIQPDDAKDVRPHARKHVVDLAVCNGGPYVDDAGICNDDVEMVDCILGLELLDGICCVQFSCRVELV